MRSFDEIIVGEEALIEHTITTKDVDDFASLTGDYNPLHMDESFAAKTPFKKRVVHGMLSASFISTVIGMKIPGTGALWFSQDLKFLLPVRIGEKITVKATVKDKSPALQIITLSTDIYTEDNRKVVEGTAKIKLVSHSDTIENSTVKLSAQINQKHDVVDVGTRPESNQRKSVLITGASGGIGSAIALKLCKEYDVFLHYHTNRLSVENLLTQITQQGFKAHIIQGDLSRENDCIKMYEEIHQHTHTLYSIIHNSSAPPIPKDYLKTSWQEIEAHFYSQVKAAYHLSQLFLPEMIATNSGSNVFISSASADGKPPIQLVGYSLAKAALNSLARTMANEFGNKNVRFNIVAPGMTETPMIADFPDKTKMLTKMQNPLRRLASPAEVANCVSFLVSEDASYINGETLRVNGGSSMI
jgi:3-oxoacyl-[acyl-carrier protein] reductase